VKAPKERHILHWPGKPDALPAGVGPASVPPQHGKRQKPAEPRDDDFKFCKGPMKLNEIIPPNPSCTCSRATLSEAAKQMKLLDVGVLPVCDQERLVGMVTDRDITVRGVADGADPNCTTVRHVMTEDAVWCYEDQEAAEAVDLMAKWEFHELPVLTREDRLFGIVSLRDLMSFVQGESRATERLEAVAAPSEQIQEAFSETP
jgi:CBS domain-containing protein